ncbi:MAG: antitoxin [Verrucomicrobia bacterium]|nr:antitoxin [Verrucomicrobiota bacterium]NBS50390.1 antitoxin [Verrucomicrobiota bacterium]
MSSKTISIELDVYRRLKRAKQARGQSFSELLRSVPLPNEKVPMDVFLGGLKSLLKRDPLAGDSFEVWERAQKEDLVPEVSN